MKNNIYRKFLEEFTPGYFVRIGENRDVNIYIGRDEQANYAIDFRGIYKPVKIVGSNVIEVSQFMIDETQFLRFSLLNSDLLECFSVFCEDLISATIGIKDDTTAYKQVQSRYMTWKRMFKPHKSGLSESEVMGLIGELLFFRDFIIPQYGIDAALESWTGPERTHKDFSLNDVWYEIKTISSGKESVRISSLEQLDSDITGYLVIYSLEKMSAEFNGIKLGELVTEILAEIAIPIQRDLFFAKLELYGFDFSPEYVNYVYAISNIVKYKVEGKFPRLVRKIIPISVSHIQYDIALAEIEDFKVE